jgi:2-polyprenyl-3-methyl-5-hydroxy-6-metoxy-1,4-benzoquinol methylase
LHARQPADGGCRLVGAIASGSSLAARAGEPGRKTIPMIECPACGQATRSQRRWSSLSFYSCKVCRVLFVHPQPTDDQLAAAYRSYYYPADATASAAYRNTPQAVGEQLLECLIHTRVIPARGGRLLDFGCGHGDFARTAMSVGIEVDAVETDDLARGAAAGHGVRVWRTLEELQRARGSGAYDAVALLDVIEHVRQPLRLLERLRRVVRPTGALYLSAPNYQSAQASLLGARWDQATNPTHLFLFSPRAMRHLLMKAGLRMTWLPCTLRDPTVGTPQGLLSLLLQRLRLSATLRVVARAI